MRLILFQSRIYISFNNKALAYHILFAHASSTIQQFCYHLHTTHTCSFMKWCPARLHHRKTMLRLTLQSLTWPTWTITILTISSTCQLTNQIFNARLILSQYRIHISFNKKTFHTTSFTPTSAPLSSNLVTASNSFFHAARWSGVLPSCIRKTLC